MASAALTAPRRVRKAQLARELGVSRQAISNLVKRGVLSEDKDGLVDVELARHAIASRVSPDSKTSQALSVVPAPAGQPVAPQALAAGQPVEELAITSYHVAKTLNESAQAKMNHLKLREMQGELIRVDAVRTAVAGAMSMAHADATLRGQAGWMASYRDRKGREIMTLRRRDVQPIDGADLTHTLDVVIQHIVESELENGCRTFNAQAGCIIVMNPQTGAVLAMSSWPTYDPNRPA